MCMKSNYINIIIIAFVLCLFSCCTNNEIETDNGVECRLYWIGDSFSQEMKETEKDDYRIISLHYLIINNTTKEFFLPIKRSISYDKIDTAYNSKIIVTIGKRSIDAWFSTDIRWNGLLKPKDSLHANLKIPEWVLDSTKTNKIIAPTELYKVLKIRYDRCFSDTVYSHFPIPQLSFTINDTIAIHYRDTIYRLNKESAGLAQPNDFVDD